MSSSQTKNAADWQSRPEAGTRTGLEFLMWVARHLGRPTLRALLYPVTLYFYFVRSPERHASRSYLSRVLDRPVRERDVFRHLLGFAHVTADRFFFLAGRGDDIPISFHAGDDVTALAQSGRAGVFLAAHLGSFEAARIFGPALGGIRMRIVLDKGINGRFVALMEEVHPELYKMIIDSEQGAVALGLAIGDAMKQGDWVGFLADRRRTADRTTRRRFLGDDATFPVGPYVIASTFKAPIMCAFCRLTGDGYEVHCEVLSDKVSFNRATRADEINALADRYIERLEHHVRASPFSWFNFFDFWANPDDSDSDN